jgi:hypothetical protein
MGSQWALTLRSVPPCVPQDSTSGKLVTQQRAIALRYLRGWFAIDFLATFPVDYIIRAVQVSN